MHDHNNSFLKLQLITIRDIEKQCKRNMKKHTSQDPSTKKMFGAGLYFTLSESLNRSNEVFLLADRTKNTLL